MEVLCFGRVVWWWPWCVVCSRLRGPNTEKPPNAAQTRTVFALAFLWFTVVMGVLCDMFASVCVFVLARARAHRTYSFRVRKIPANKRHHYRRNVHTESTHTHSHSSMIRIAYGDRTLGSMAT